MPPRQKVMTKDQTSQREQKKASSDIEHTYFSTCFLHVGCSHVVSPKHVLTAYLNTPQVRWKTSRKAPLGKLPKQPPYYPNERIPRIQPEQFNTKNRIDKYIANHVVTFSCSQCFCWGCAGLMFKASKQLQLNKQNTGRQKAVLNVSGRRVQIHNDAFQSNFLCFCSAPLARRCQVHNDTFENMFTLAIARSYGEAILGTQRYCAKRFLIVFIRASGEAMLL